MDKKANETLICEICSASNAKYSCPRCSIPYCSLVCYQNEAHLNCSESFYKECVLEEGQEGCDVVKMNEMLRKHHESIAKGDDALDSDDEDVDDDLLKRLEGIDLMDSGELWKKLSEEQRKGFIGFCNSDEVAKYIEHWKPWWDSYASSKVIDIEELNDMKKNCPQIKENIKSLSQLSAQKPADCVQYNMINIIAAYTYILRYSNGEHHDFPKETATYIHHLSNQLKGNVNFAKYDEAIASVVHECTNNQYGINIDEENVEHMKKDVDAILKGPHLTERKYYLLAAFSDLSNIFKSAINFKEPKDEFYMQFMKHHEFVSIRKEQLKKNIQKMNYYLSFITSAYP